MKWMKERDLLIAQTMAFVQSITGHKPEIERRDDTRIEVAPPDELEKSGRPVEVIQMTRPSVVADGDFREEIQRRVAAFRAHQQLFHRERDAYFTAVLTRARASIDSAPKAPGD